MGYPLGLLSYYLVLETQPWYLGWNNLWECSPGTRDGAPLGTQPPGAQARFHLWPYSHKWDIPWVPPPAHHPSAWAGHHGAHPQPREPLGLQGGGVRHEEAQASSHSPPLPAAPAALPAPLRPSPPHRGRPHADSGRGAEQRGAGPVSAGRTGRPRSYPHPSAFPHPCPHPRPRGGGWIYSPPPSRRCHLLISAFALTRGAGCISRELRAPICGVPALRHP